MRQRGKDKSESHKALNYFSGGYDAQAGRAEREAEEKNKKKFAQQHQGTLQKLAGEKPLVGGSSEKKKSHSSKKKGAAGKQKQESEGEESDEEPKVRLLRRIGLLDDSIDVLDYRNIWITALRIHGRRIRGERRPRRRGPCGFYIGFAVMQCRFCVLLKSLGR